MELDSAPVPGWPIVEAPKLLAFFLICGLGMDLPTRNFRFSRAEERQGWPFDDPPEPLGWKV